MYMHNVDLLFVCTYLLGCGAVFLLTRSYMEVPHVVDPPTAVAVIACWPRPYPGTGAGCLPLAVQLLQLRMCRLDSAPRMHRYIAPGGREAAAGCAQTEQRRTSNVWLRTDSLVSFGVSFQMDFLVTKGEIWSPKGKFGRQNGTDA